jgi:hypothetical protein
LSADCTCAGLGMSSPRRAAQKVARAVAPKGGSGMRQLVYYHTGVGPGRFERYVAARSASACRGTSRRCIASSSRISSRGRAVLLRLLRHPPPRARCPDRRGVRALPEPKQPHASTRHRSAALPVHVFARGTDPIHRRVGHGGRARWPSTRGGSPSPPLSGSCARRTCGPSESPIPHEFAAASAEARRRNSSYAPPNLASYLDSSGKVVQVRLI